MKNIKRNIAVLLLTLSTLVSCTEALEEKSFDFIGPDRIGSSSVRDAELWVNGVLSSIPDQMFRWGAYPKILDMDSDDFTGPDWGMGSFGAGNFPGFWAMNTIWAENYKLIHRCNYAIPKIQGMSITDAEKNQYLGELYFLRAWAYHWMVRCYGGVPILKIAVTDGQTPQNPRATVKEVYDFVIEDLKLAEQNMYKNTDAAYKTGRLSQGAASALLARVYLDIASGASVGKEIRVLGGPRTESVAGKLVRIPEPISQTFSSKGVEGLKGMDAAPYFVLARDKAKEMMDGLHGEYELFDTYADIWTTGHRNISENIWSHQSLSNDLILGNGTAFDYGGIVNASGDLLGGWYGLSTHWYELFEEQDQRIMDGVLHRWHAFGSYKIYPAKDTLIARNYNKTPAAIAKKQRYGYDSTDYTAESSEFIVRLTKFRGVMDNTLERSDFHFPFIRYSDVLLIFAEADNEANNGPSAAAYEAINAVRDRSDASAVSGMTQVEFRSFVLEERRREFGLEGIRRWDMIRWGFYVDAMNAIDIDENKVLKRRQDKHLLYPIPIEEINGNDFIETNNPGW